MLERHFDDKETAELTKGHWAPFIDNINGRVGIPILLYFMGVPGIVVLFLWAFFFRGK